ncbi:TPA: hypothetical protein MJC91_21135 [Klebsiella pneumoniae]|nr:hypothetical protein [Klebsiella pneumoniae]
MGKAYEWVFSRFSWTSLNEKFTAAQLVTERLSLPYARQMVLIQCEIMWSLAPPLPRQVNASIVAPDIQDVRRRAEMPEIGDHF